MNKKWEIKKGFNEKALYEIAKTSGNKQLKNDVKYMRLPMRNGTTVYAERIDGVAFWGGITTKTISEYPA